MLHHGGLVVGGEGVVAGQPHGGRHGGQVVGAVTTVPYKVIMDKVLKYLYEYKGINFKICIKLFGVLLNHLPPLLTLFQPRLLYLGVYTFYI